MANKEKWYCLAHKQDSDEALEVPREDIPELLSSGASVWVDLTSPTARDMAWLRKTFGFHKLALSDVLNNATRPKQETYGEVLFTVFSAIDIDTTTRELVSVNLNLFLTKNVIVTIFSELAPPRLLETTARRRNTSALTMGPDYLYYNFLDFVIDRYFDVIEELETEVDTLERAVFRDGGRAVQEQIFQTKQKFVELRRSIASKREALRCLVHDHFPQIRAETRTHLRDVLDHVIKIGDSIESSRELLSSLFEVYMSQLSSRLNESIKMMSVIATVMLPLSFLTGIFGMNFDYVPLLKWQPGFWVLIGFMVTLVSCMIWLFRKYKIL